MKKLPKLFKNEIDKPLNNNKKYCYLKEETSEQVDKLTIDEKINKIFNGLGNAYNVPVKIKTKDKVFTTSLVSKTKNNLVTLDNEVIKIEDIISIDEKI